MVFGIELPRGDAESTAGYFPVWSAKFGNHAFRLSHDSASCKQTHSVMRSISEAVRLLFRGEPEPLGTAIQPGIAVITGVLLVDALLSWFGDRLLHRSPNPQIVGVHAEYLVRLVCTSGMMLACVSRDGLLERLGLRKSSLMADLQWTVRLLLIGGACLLVAVAGALVAYWAAGGRLAPPAPAQIAWARSASIWAFLLRWGSVTLVAAPLVEETIYRGFALPGLLARLRPWQAILVNALVFALLHAGPYGRGFWVPAELLGGVLFSLTFWLRKSIVPGILIHAAGNLCFLIMPVARMLLHSITPGLFAPG